jgi:endonuclease YncB( thermonuclease family)
MWFWASPPSPSKPPPKPPLESQPIPQLDDDDLPKSLQEQLFSISKIKLSSTEIILSSFGLTAFLLLLRSIYSRRLKRIPTVSQVPHDFLKNKRTLFGTIVSVGDADNFRLFHTPGGRLLGWGFLRRIPTSRRDLAKAGTLHVRLAGIDAPEGAHFGNPAQPYAKEAQEWLTKYILGRRVRVKLLSKDRYERVLGSTKIWRWGWRRDVSYEMAKAGWAGVYNSAGAEYDGMEDQIRKVVETAKYVDSDRFFLLSLD